MVFAGMKRRRGLLGSVVCALVLWAPLSVQAVTYYVSSQGNDAWSGTSQSQPWRTIGRVNQQNLNPGDQVLFQAKQTFSGSLYLAPEDTGTLASPVVIGSYGDGRALISSGTKKGLFAYNVNGLTVRDLNFVGSGSTVSTEAGVSIYTDAADGREGVKIYSIDVSKYGKNGIEIGGWNNTHAYRHVRISFSDTHHNRNNGLIIYGQVPYANEDVYVEYVDAYYNSGIPGQSGNSGSGIVLGNVRQGTVEFSKAYENGWLCDASEGPAGIWTYDSTEVVIQSNQSFRNRTGGPADGDGYDLDRNVSYSTLQYNESYENEGAGYFMAHSPNNTNHTGNIVRNNTSRDDGRKNSYGGIVLWGRIRNATVQDNDVTISPALSGKPAAVVVANWSIPWNCVENVLFTGNTFETSSGARLVNVSPSQVQCSSGLRFHGNSYYAAGSFRILWGSKEYSSVKAWHNATGQE